MSPTNLSTRRVTASFVVPSAADGAASAFSMFLGRRVAGGAALGAGS